MGVGPGDRVAERLRERAVEILAEVAAHHVAAEGQRQLRVPFPGLAEVEDLVQAQRLVRDLTFVDQQAQVRLSLQNRRGDLVERDFDDRRIADVEAQQQRGGGVLAGDRRHALLELGPRDRLARDEDRPVALPHRGAGIHHPIPVGDEEVPRDRARGPGDGGGRRRLAGPCG